MRRKESKTSTSINNESFHASVNTESHHQSQIERGTLTVYIHFHIHIHTHRGKKTCSTLRTVPTPSVCVGGYLPVVRLLRLRLVLDVHRRIRVKLLRAVNLVSSDTDDLPPPPPSSVLKMSEHIEDESWRRLS